MFLQKGLNFGAKHHVVMCYFYLRLLFASILWKIFVSVFVRYIVLHNHLLFVTHHSLAHSFIHSFLRLSGCGIKAILTSYNGLGSVSSALVLWKRLNSCYFSFEGWETCPCNKFHLHFV